MSLFCHGTIQITTPAKIGYDSAHWSRIEFKAVSVDPHHKICKQHEYLCELIVPKESRDFAEQLIPGTWCIIPEAKVESPLGKNFTKIVISYRYFEVLDLNTQGDQDG